ncbi:hypothetical protein RF11_12841 [Thelohanellus kitauei]|uniref:Uncharacterized protein n=1 Tax=Thelohanellus kitauei TaxID=669202 RepID=A0A0C2MID5_THEKT|nr:hypothetical protein RF11_12841 [Thelohanellus kitauei]
MSVNIGEENALEEDMNLENEIIQSDASINSSQNDEITNLFFSNQPETKNANLDTENDEILEFIKYLKMEFSNISPTQNEKSGNLSEELMRYKNVIRELVKVYILLIQDRDKIKTMECDIESKNQLITRVVSF